MSQNQKVTYNTNYDQYNLNLIFIVLITLQAIVAIIIYFIPPFSNMELNQQINVFLSWAIVQFTVIGAISTWLQYAVSEKRNKLEDSRFELEKVYGPLFTFLSSYKKRSEDVDEFLMDSNQLSYLDNIFSTYPHILSKHVYDYWKENLHNVDPDLTGYNTVYYHVPIDFVNMCINEYNEKLNSYRKLLKIR